MAVREILLLGNPKLFEICEPVQKTQLEQIKPIIQDLHDTLMAFRQKYNAGRAIAAPQIGAMKRVVYMHIGEPVVFINPVLDLKRAKMMELWDDCMSFPELLVKVSIAINGVESGIKMRIGKNEVWHLKEASPNFCSTR